ncbi:KGGVGR-motif variant AAA ATPase [Anabaena azotica]|uniref:KGGVGR-motif variant AAA ATPase n=1 Tax=Anabaena azotica TaxID=197653 RepID=UPI0039A60AD6
MRTITFYSYKGGVGRTLSAANFAVYLAKLGLKTVVIDFDIEAPGIDAKFSMLKLPVNQKGILDYILEYQLNNQDPGSVNEICLHVPITSNNYNLPLWLIPAGQYLAEEYYRKLNLLDWSFIFSEQRNGVAFFQNLIARIKEELKPDFIIIDSRTGITESAGLCTQQLADEVVMISSLSSESINVTKHIKQIIKQSKVAKSLGKSVDVKVVVSRVPKPEDLEAFKERCCKLFEIEESKLFFLFSCPDLELEEFLAITNTDKSEELVSNYIRLFYGLKIELADQNIRTEIERTVSSILSVSPQEAEKKILGLVALYPHPEAYRTAMRFFQLSKKQEDMKIFGWKLLDLMPNDEDALAVLANSYLTEASLSFRMKNSEKRNALRVLEPLWQKGKLNSKSVVIYAGILEELELFSQSLEVALSLCQDNQVDSKVQIQARSIAARSAIKLGQNEIAAKLVDDIPQEQLDRSLALVAMELRKESDDLDGAFEIGKQVLTQDFSLSLLKSTVSIARQLDRIEELEEALSSSREINLRVRRNPNFIREINQLGLHKLAADITSIVADDLEF